MSTMLLESITQKDPYTHDQQLAVEVTNTLESELTLETTDTDVSGPLAVLGGTAIALSENAARPDIEHPVDESGNLLPIQNTDLRAVPDWAYETGLSVRGLERDVLTAVVKAYRRISPSVRSHWSFGSSTSHTALADLGAGGGLRSVLSHSVPYLSDWGPDSAPGHNGTWK